MESVLLIGRIRPDRSAAADRLLAAGGLGCRVFRQGATLALLVEPPQAEAHFLRLLHEGRSALARLLGCLEDVPLLPRELTPH